MGAPETVSRWSSESKAKPSLGLSWEVTVETGQADLSW